MKSTRHTGWRPEWRRRSPAEKRERAERRAERRARRLTNEAVNALLDAGHAVDGAAVVAFYEAVLADELAELGARRLT